MARTPGSAIIAMNTNAIIRAETVKIKVRIGKFNNNSYANNFCTNLGVIQTKMFIQGKMESSKFLVINRDTAAECNVNFLDFALTQRY